MAFAARYGHTPPNVTRHMPVSELVRFTEQVGRLIEEESEAMRRTGQD